MSSSPTQEALRDAIKQLEYEYHVSRGRSLQKSFRLIKEQDVHQTMAQMYDVMLRTCRSLKQVHERELTDDWGYIGELEYMLDELEGKANDRD